MINTSKEKNVYSEQYKEEENVKEFMNYLVDSEVSLSIIKYMIHLRGCDSYPEDPLKILRGHFSSETNEKMQNYKSLISEYQVLKNENELLNKEHAQLEELLEQERENARLREIEEEQKRLEEEKNAENNKKKKGK